MKNKKLKNSLKWDTQSLTKKEVKKLIKSVNQKPEGKQIIKAVVIDDDIVEIRFEKSHRDVRGHVKK